MKTAVIGSGIGGLLSALYAEMRGEDVTIFEKDDSLGGRLSFIEKDGFKIDKGPTIVLLPNMIKSILADVGIGSDEYELIQIDPLYKLSYPDGTTFTKWSDKQKQLEEINRMYPGEEEHFLRYLSDMERNFEEGKRAFLDVSFVQKRDFWTVTNVRTLWKLKAYQTVKQQAESYFTNQKLQEAFSFQTLYIGGAPFQSPALYSLVPYSEHVHGIWYVKGGYASLIDSVINKINEKNITVKRNHKVEKLVHEQDTCKGVIVNGKMEEFEQIIVNGDFPLMEKVVGVKENQYVPSSGCLLVYLGLDKIYKEANVHQFFMTEDLERHMKDVFVTKQLPEDPSIYSFHPSIIDPSLAPNGKGVLYMLVPVPVNSEINWKKISSYVDKVIDEVENRGFPNLRKSILWKEVRTPKDAENEGLYMGGSFGIAPSLLQSGVFRPQLKPFKYDNVYAVGASTHPGGGVPIVMQGAKLLHQFIEERVVQDEGSRTSVSAM
ncbi:phytoene desaturase family protein [Bacillus alkalicellulosilyticus]|uniref:phytoene desaturase family protein n=1 Tax=Alkalihalobacterium alkalicellulosilyticum TaxID=1912214 RepID=UPI000996AE5D|nr:phytoene desaturase family protein [Bacillus alkalicellulosilyticus]